MRERRLFGPCYDSMHSECIGVTIDAECNCYCHVGVEPAGFRITSIHAFISVDPEDGDEGVIAQQMWDGSWMPLIAADETRLEILRPVAQAIAWRTEREVKLVRFSVREDIETLEVTNERAD